MPAMLSAMLDLLTAKIPDNDYRSLIVRHADAFGKGERLLLAEILTRFEFDIVQQQALANAVLQQSRFDPDAACLFDEDDEDTTGSCPHCLNPPMPPLRDYLIWRESRS